MTHRIISAKRQKTGSPIFRTQGDANAAPDMRTFKLDQPTQARYRFSVPYLGWAFIALGNPHARFLLLALPALLIALSMFAQALARGRPAGRRAWNDLMRRTPVVIAAAVLLLVIAAVASAGPRDAELGRIAAEGPVTLSSNHPGRALLHADHIKPGDSVTGLVSLSNKGDQPGALVLGVTGKRDRPGAYGGRLSRVLKLKIEDLSGKAPHARVRRRARVDVPARHASAAARRAPTA